MRLLCGADAQDECMAPSDDVSRVKALMGEQRFAEAAPLSIRAADGGDVSARRRWRNGASRQSHPPRPCGGA
jgi:hypothetical protein